MSGRYEKDMKINNKIKEKLENMPEILTDYYYSLIGAGKSYVTAESYIYYIEQFIKFKYKRKCPQDFYNDVQPRDINMYISSLRTKVVGNKRRKISDSYKTTSWSALNSFFQFLIPNYISVNPVSATERPKMKDNPDVTYLEEDEMNLLFENIKKKANYRMLNRDLCILKLGFATGLRVSALVQIDIQDIDLNNNRIKVVEKGDREFYIFIGNNLKHQIILWMEDRKKYFNWEATDALFISQESNRISPRTIRDLLEKYSDGLEKHVTPHVMRHTCATNLYEKTGDIYLCANQLNHRNVSTTQRYAEISKSRKAEATNILDDLI